MNILNLKISGITCGACIKLIERKIGRISGVTNVDVTDKSGETTVLSEDKIQVADIANALSGTPYAIVGGE